MALCVCGLLYCLSKVELLRICVGVFQHPGGHPKPSLLKHGRISTACKGAALSRCIRESCAHITSAADGFFLAFLEGFARVPRRLDCRDVLGLHPAGGSNAAPRGRRCSRPGGSCGIRVGQRSLSTIKQHHLQAPRRPVLLRRLCRCRSGGWMCRHGPICSGQAAAARSALPASPGRAAAPGGGVTERRTSDLPLPG